MFKSLISCLSFLAAYYGNLVYADYMVTVENVEFHGNEQFPEVIDVVFSYQGYDSYLRLYRDDETTDMLSESVFEASSFLPTGLFTKKKSQEFAAYDSGNSNVLVVHREADDADPKFYGRFTQDNEKLVIQSEDRSHVHHRVRREEKHEIHQRTRRAAATPTNVIELFIFADLSIYEHFQSELVPSNKVYTSVKEYLSTLAKEVDAIYDYLDVYGTNTTLRVYFQQYQIIDNSSQQAWVENNLLGGKLQTTAVDDFQAYYNKLYTKFAFPYPDHVMAVTKLEMEGGIQVMTSGKVCGDPSNVGASIIRIDNFQAAMAQAIAITFGVSLDGDGNACQDSDQYLMSTTYGAVTDQANQGNRWKFSPCSVSQFQSALDGGMDLSCLQTEDIYFDWKDFDNSPYMSEQLTIDEQCVVRYQNGATFCDESNGNVVDCYSSTQGCLVGGICEPFNVAHLTSCGLQGSSTVCKFGFCIEPTLRNTTAATDATRTKNTTAATRATDAITTKNTTAATIATNSTRTKNTTAATRATNNATATSSTRSSTDSNNNGLQTTTEPFDCVVRTLVNDYDLPGCSCSGCGSNTDSDTVDCEQAPDCIGKKVRITTRYVHESCASQYQPGPRRIITNPGDAKNTQLTAEVYKGDSGKWMVQLVEKEK